MEDIISYSEIKPIESTRVDRWELQVYEGKLCWVNVGRLEMAERYFRSCTK